MGKIRNKITELAKAVEPFVLQQIEDIINQNPNYLQGARVRHSSNTNILDSTSTYLNFNTEDYDTDSIHDTVTNNTRLTCQTAGKYLIVANISWESDVNGARNCSIILNRTTNIASVQDDASTAGVHRQNPSTVYNLSVGQYVEVSVRQTSSSTIQVLADGGFSPAFAMQRIG